MKALNAKGRSVLVIGDTHIPYAHIDYTKWLKAVKKKYLNKKSLVLHIGDEVDFNKFSFHEPHDPDIEFSPSSELQACIDEIHKPGGLYKLFPKLYLCSSNHGDLIYRRASKKGGLPLHVIKSYSEILQVKNWEWHEDYLLDTKQGPVYIHHGRSSNIAKVVASNQSSVIQGHYHGLHKIEIFQGIKGKFFGCQTGCLVDESNRAFNYGKLSLSRPILGSALIKECGTPTLLTMNLDKNNRWDGIVS